MEMPSNISQIHRIIRAQYFFHYLSRQSALQNFLEHTPHPLIHDRDARSLDSPRLQHLVSIQTRDSHC